MTKAPMIFVVDTNVPIVANGNSEQVSPKCVETCVLRLERLMNNDKLILDDQWLILKEYQNNLRSEGQPGVGNAFLKWVLTNRCNSQRCELVRITPIDSSSTNFSEFPSDKRLSSFDSDDKIFVAVSKAHTKNPPILEAVDPGFWKFKDILNSNGVIVEFLCESEIQSFLN